MRGKYLNIWACRDHCHSNHHRPLTPNPPFSACWMLGLQVDSPLTALNPTALVKPLAWLEETSRKEGKKIKRGERREEREIESQNSECSRWERGEVLGEIPKWWLSEEVTLEESGITRGKRQRQHLSGKRHVQRSEMIKIVVEPKEAVRWGLSAS